MYFSVTLCPDIYLQKTLYFFVFQRNIELKTGKHEFTDISDQNKQGFEGMLSGTELRLKGICARHCRLGQLKAKILTVFLPRFSRLFCLLSSKILQNNLLDLHLVEICRCKLSFYAKTSQILLTTHRHFSTFLKNRCVKLKTRRGLELGA